MPLPSSFTCKLEYVALSKPTFGIFDHIEAIPGTSTQQILRDRLDIIKKADDAGFSGYYFAEHHGTDLCLVPNQDLIIAAASQITSTIRMGPMVKLLPLHHPVRMIAQSNRIRHPVGWNPVMVPWYHLPPPLVRG